VFSSTFCLFAVDTGQVRGRLQRCRLDQFTWYWSSAGATA